MFHQLEISRFRCFEQFEVNELTRLSLLVGRNNAGKTCLLEALAVLADGGPAMLAKALRYRGELVHVELTEDEIRATAPEARHAFHGRTMARGAEFVLRSQGDRAQDHRAVRVTLGELRASTGDGLTLEPGAGRKRRRPIPAAPAHSALHWELTVNGEQESIDVPIGPEGRVEFFDRPRRATGLPVRFIRTDVGDRDDIAELWGPIAATEHEDSVVELLRVVEPEIEKIAATPGYGGGIFVRQRGVRGRIPLGSFGEGTSRLFALACSLITVRGGILLVDEIDTGLHVSTMVQLWRFLAAAARRHDVQVFATTHSDDCIRGLADYLRGDADACAWTKQYRIERGSRIPTVYSGEQIIRTSEADIEVR